MTQIFVWYKLVSVTLTFFCEESLFLWPKVFVLQYLVCVTQTCCVKNTLSGGILYMISREKVSWEMGVSVFSDNQDNHFVEPCLEH